MKNIHNILGRRENQSSQEHKHSLRDYYQVNEYFQYIFHRKLNFCKLNNGQSRVNREDFIDYLHRKFLYISIIWCPDLIFD
jgi:hypothetical protein